MKNIMKYNLIAILAIFIIQSCQKDEAIEEIVNTKEAISPNRIAWNFNSLVALADDAGYARMIELDNGDFVCVYGKGGSGAELIRSTDKGETWSSVVVVARDEHHATSNGFTFMANSEIVQLSDGNLIYSYNRRPAEPFSSERKFAIAYKVSEDNGYTWGEEKVVYEASHIPHDGCWEPQILQLKSGELQLYFANEFPYQSSADQEISMMRSMDNGTTWGSPEKIAYVPNSRDGMAVALELENGEILMSIEDPSHLNFKPAIIRSSNNWANAPVGKPSQDREYALNHDLNNNAYQGAPYICVLPSGNIALAYQGTDGSSNVDLGNSRMLVEVGDKEGRNFNNNSRPFKVPYERAGLWNAISVLDGKVWALTTSDVDLDNDHYDRKSRVWGIQGYEITNYKVPQGEIVIDGATDTSNDNVAFFVGSKNESNAMFSLSQTNDKLFVSAVIKDESIYASNGVIVGISTKNDNAEKPASGNYLFNIYSNGDYKAKEGFNGKWESKDINADALKVTKNSKGYIVEFSISWSKIGGKPVNTEQRIGFNVGLIETGYTEYLIHSNMDMPYTWGSIQL
ncbi:MAG: exo-alpha-sialidase [Bacteroidota bacterium]